MNILCTELTCQSDSQNIFKACRCFASCFKQFPLIKCCSFEDKLSVPSSEDDNNEEEEEEIAEERQKQIVEEGPITNTVEEDEVFVSEIISRYMESKSKRKSPNKATPGLEENSLGGEDSTKEEYRRLDNTVSVQTSFKRSLSVERIDFVPNYRRRSDITEALVKSRNVFSTPPLPKSPSDSWSWRKRVMF